MPAPRNATLPCPRPARVPVRSRPRWTQGSLVVALLGLALLGSGCAEAAESAEREGAPPETTERSQTDSTQDPVARYLAAAGPDRAREELLLEALRDAVQEAVNEREPAEARRVAAARADAILQELAVVEDWRPLLRAELLAPLGDTLGVEEALGLVDPATELHRRWGWSLRVEAREAAGDSTGARSVAQFEARGADDAAGAAGPWARAGRLALAAGDTAGARDAFLLALEAGPGHPGARAAAQALDRVHTGSLQEDLRIGRALLEGGELERGVRRLGPLLEAEGPGAPGEVETADLRTALGQALVELRRPGEARAMVAPLLGELVPADVAAPALFLDGQAALQQNRPAEAEEAFYRLARRAPENPLAEEGMLLLVRRAMDGGRPSTESPLMREFFRVGVGTAESELVAVQFGSSRYLAGDYTGAAATFDRYLEGARRPGTRQQAAYWAALSHLRLGDERRAQDRLQTAWSDDPLSFYGILAGERLDLQILDPALEPGPRPVPGLGGELRSALTRLRVHQVVPTPGSFVHELERLESHFFRRGDGAYDFAEALMEGGFPIQAVVLGRELHRREGGVWNLRLLRIVFPFPYREDIVREARARGLDPFFVAGLIRQESMFHASISSSAGALGLMQLMPGTAQEVARSLGIRYDPAQLSNPAYNVRLGTEYLASMLRRFGGRAEDALSAYNAGPGRINQWRQRPEYRDRDVFMEHIPFRETRHYVKVVQQYTRIYTALYGCAGFEPCLGDSYLAAVARSPYAGGQPGSALAR